MSRSACAELGSLVRQARVELHQARHRQHLERAWQLLQERDDAGNPRGPLPYTEAALAELQQAYAADPEQPRLLHHLAVACHAHAWDLELQGDPRAAAQWQQALDYWDSLRASRHFWEACREKLQACDAGANPAVIDELRRTLMPELLQIHVAFIRHYCERGELSRATAHVEIVRRAAIPLVERRRLIDRVFEAMTASVPEALAAQAYDSATVVADRFLQMFPDHLPALRMHAEVIAQALGRLSYQSDWDRIKTLATAADAYVLRLGEHPDLAGEPLAQAALVAAADVLIDRAFDRGRSWSEATPTRAANPDLVCEATDLAIPWARLAAPWARTGPLLRNRLACCLNLRALALADAAGQFGEELEGRAAAAAAVTLYERICTDVEEALALQPDDECLIHNLEVFRSRLAHAQMERRFIGL